MTISALRAECKLWQERLMLQDWVITIRWAKRGETEKFCHGLIFWTTEMSSAIIVISRKSDDHRHTLIHELLHLRLEGHKAEAFGEDVTFEQGLNALATCLKKAYEVVK